MTTASRFSAADLALLGTRRVRCACGDRAGDHMRPVSRAPWACWVQDCPCLAFDPDEAALSAAHVPDGFIALHVFDGDADPERSLVQAGAVLVVSPRRNSRAASSVRLAGTDYRLMVRESVEEIAALLDAARRRLEP